jgi:hypothetical protein
VYSFLTVFSPLLGPAYHLGRTMLWIDAARSKPYFAERVLAATAPARDRAVAIFDREFRKFIDVRVERP